MKRFVTFGCLVTLLGACAVVPVAYPVYERPHQYHGGYYADGWHGHGYGWRNQGYYRR